MRLPLAPVPAPVTRIRMSMTLALSLERCDGIYAAPGSSSMGSRERSIPTEPVIPVGHRVTMSVDEPHAAVLRDHDGDGVRHGMAKAIGGAVPCPDGVDELRHERVGFEVHCASHLGN